MKCLVTGATGFVGRALCRQLQVSGHSVVACSREGGRLEGGTAVAAVDLNRHSIPAELLASVDAVFHLAGIAHRDADPGAYEQLNHRAAVTLARAAHAAGVRSFVFFSSVKAMGPASGGRPRQEAECRPPATAYGLSKWRAEEALRREFGGPGMSVVILRPALVYGPGAKANLALLARAVARGVPRPPDLGGRSMIGVSDLCALALAVATAAPGGVHTWIVTDGECYTTRRLYDALCRARGRDPGRAWLPAWVWRLACRARDLRRAPGESSWQRLFGAELYSNRALLEAVPWRPRESFETALAAEDGRC